MARKLTYQEKQQIEKLEARKEHLIWQLIGACNEINDQIKYVKGGNWLKDIQEGEKDDDK